MNGCTLVGFINFDFLNLSRAQSIFNKLLRRCVIGYNVDLLLIANFVHHSLNTCSVSANKGTNRVNARNGACDSKFRATTSFTGNTLNFYRTGFQFWNVILRIRNGFDSRPLQVRAARFWP